MLSALLLVAAVHGPLTFIEDDHPKALATARAAQKLLFIDFWATWCHSCLSMQRFVLSDAGMKPIADAHLDPAVAGAGHVIEVEPLIAGEDALELVEIANVVLWHRRPLESCQLSAVSPQLQRIRRSQCIRFSSILQG